MTAAEYDIGPAVHTDELKAAHDVWAAANAARGRTPSPERRARVHVKLSDPEADVVVARHLGSVIGMALAEAGREDDGAGPPRPGWGYIAMVFVHPEWWGHGVGGQVLDHLHLSMAARGWHNISLWTRPGNERALGLYRSRGYLVNGRKRALANGAEIVLLERDPMV